ncbi:MAG: DUF1223 domain-containing protein, partial [Betaproteobacteria bacterium]|nr:DUF1223 domain-containing protein [Betaproteobacteria bacterium]
MHTSLTRCVALGATLALASALPAGAQQPACYTPSTAQTTALVELYTSEGCDSCPPADQWLATLKPGTRIVPIAWHVGYWDSLGWKDRFALPDAAPRQRLQTQRDGGRTVYTPQVMVQGHRVDWRDAAQFERAVDAVQAKAAPLRIAVAQGLPYNGYLGVELDGGTQQPGVVGYVALLEDQIVSQVSAGENR